MFTGPIVSPKSNRDPEFMSSRDDGSRPASIVMDTKVRNGSAMYDKDSSGFNNSYRLKSSLLEPIEEEHAYDQQSK